MILNLEDRVLDVVESVFDYCIIPLNTMGVLYLRFLSRLTSSMSNFDMGIKCTGRLL